MLSWPEVIARNKKATVEITGRPNTEYSIKVHYKSGPSKASGLEAKVSDANGYVTWTWRVGSNTAPGTYRIEISDGEESITLYFTVVENEG